MSGQFSGNQSSRYKEKSLYYCYLWHNWDLVQHMWMCMLLHETDNLLCLHPKLKRLGYALSSQGAHKQVWQAALSTDKQPQNGDLQL